MYETRLYAIDKQYVENLENKIKIFKEKARIKKQIFLAMICVSGLKQTIYSEQIVDGGVVTLDEWYCESSNLGCSHERRKCFHDRIHEDEMIYLYFHGELKIKRFVACATP